MWASGSSLAAALLNGLFEHPAAVVESVSNNVGTLLMYATYSSPHIAVIPQAVFLPATLSRLQSDVRSPKR